MAEFTRVKIVGEPTEKKITSKKGEEMTLYNVPIVFTSEFNGETVQDSGYHTYWSKDEVQPKGEYYAASRLWQGPYKQVKSSLILIPAK
tara:strand:+ start:5777 stop:6043 length:267 start_codon:yes stop_codon:yes gene_type:complete